MRHSIILAAFIAVVCGAVTGDFDWQSFPGVAGEQCSLIILESDSRHLLVQVTIPGFYLSRCLKGEETWHCIELPGYSSQTEPGLPEVPCVSRMFALPFGTHAAVTVSDIEYTTYTGIRLVPAQMPEIDMPHNPYPFRQNHDAYTDDNFAPVSRAQVSNPAVWGGINTERLTVYPFTYNPVTKELQAAVSITVRIDFNGEPEAIAFPSTETINSIASRMLLNYDKVASHASALPLGNSEGTEYLFLTIEENLNAVLPLVEFYQSIGYKTAVQSFSRAPSSEEITAAIQDRYDTGVTRFALLAGDHQALPSYNYGAFVGDYHYACVSGNDLAPEIAVGRLTGSPGQISTQVTKIIEGYYQYDFAGSGSASVIPATGALVAHQEGYPESYTACCNEIATADYIVDMSWNRVFPPEGGTNLTVQNLFNNGIGSVGYRGHGFALFWSWAPRWTKSNIHALTNTFTPPVWNIACYCGLYQNDSECLAESFAWNNNGAGGNLAATNPSYTDANHDYMKQIYLGLYDQGNYCVGETLNEAAVWIINNHGYEGEENAKMFIWFGDPAMEIFTNDEANPEPLQIDCTPNSVYPGTRTIDIEVTCCGSPVRGSLVSLSDGIDGIDPVSFQNSAVTGSNGRVTFTVDIPEGVSRLYSGARRHNYNPATALIEVNPILEGEIEGFKPAGVTVIPNPVIASSSVNFTTRTTGISTIQVIDITGRVVETLISEPLAKGHHSLVWTPDAIAGGIYFIQLSTPAEAISTQVVILH